jgi:general secretion pathway protein N
MMNGPKRSGPALLLPLLVCSLLAAMVYLELESAPRLAAAVAPGGDSMDVAPLPPAVAYEPPPASTFDGVLARPLFSPSRRPPDDAPALAVEAAPVLAAFELELVGVLINGEERVALVRQPGVAVLLRLAPGAVAAGWTVESIEPDRVLFRSGTRLEEAQLRDDATPPPEAQPSREDREERRRRRAAERRDVEERTAE